jgi:cobalamin biosynthesis Mg chelatase CobN
LTTKANGKGEIGLFPCLEILNSQNIPTSEQVSEAPESGATAAFLSSVVSSTADLSAAASAASAAASAASAAASAASAASAQAEVPEGPAWVENIWGLQCWGILGG